MSGYSLPKTNSTHVNIFLQRVLKGLLDGLLAQPDDRDGLTLGLAHHLDLVRPRLWN